MNKKFSTTDLLSGLLISYIYVILCINEKDKIKLTTFVTLLEKEAKLAKKSLAADVLLTDAIGVVVSWDKIKKIVLDDLGIIETYLRRAKKLGGFKESVSSIRKLLQTGTKNSDFIANDVHPLDVLTPAVLESSLAQLSNLTEFESSLGLKKQSPIIMLDGSNLSLAIAILDGIVPVFFKTTVSKTAPLFEDLSTYQVLLLLYIMQGGDAITSNGKRISTAMVPLGSNLVVPNG